MCGLTTLAFCAQPMLMLMFVINTRLCWLAKAQAHSLNANTTTDLYRAAETPLNRRKYYSCWISLLWANISIWWNLERRTNCLLTVMLQWIINSFSPVTLNWQLNSSGFQSMILKRSWFGSKMDSKNFSSAFSPDTDIFHASPAGPLGSGRSRDLALS